MTTFLEFLSQLGDEPFIEATKSAYKAIFESQITAYHGSDKDIKQFNDRAFFSTNKQYASMYKNGKKSSKVYTVNLEVEKPFNTATDPTALDVYNNGFVPYWKAKFPRLSEGLKELQQGEMVNFLWTDQLFSYLRKLMRENNLQYDAIIVDEGFKGNTAIVPMKPEQIIIIKEEKN